MRDEPIHLDHHATTPCDPRVVDAMLPFFTERFGNAGSGTHRYGLQAGAAVERARAQVAALLGVAADDLVFTSGATEADNLAILGVATAAGRGHLVTTAIEHRAVLDPVAHAERYGFAATLVQVGSSGVVDPDAVVAAVRPDTVLVSVMLANNEIGTVQPIAAIAAALKARGVPLHVDAAQGAGLLPLDAAALGADLISLSAHKAYGPKGIGALWIRRGAPALALAPLTFGGGQERGLRPGTLPVPLIVGFGEAAELARAALSDGTTARLTGLRDRLRDGLLAIDGAHLHGCATRRLPNNVNVRFDRVRAGTLIARVRDVVALSAGSACSSTTGRPSHVIAALGVAPADALGALRFGLGRTTTEREIDEVLDAVGAAVAAIRAGPARA